jgi:hypothetical protein
MADDSQQPSDGADSAPTPASTPGAGQAAAPGEPRRSWLSRIIGQGPAARRRLSEAVVALLGTFLVALAAIGSLLIWHLVRRARLIRHRLAPPRIVQLPELPESQGDPHDHDEVPPA